MARNTRARKAKAVNGMDEAHSPNEGGIPITPHIIDAHGGALVVSASTSNWPASSQLAADTSGVQSGEAITQVTNKLRVGAPKFEPQTTPPHVTKLGVLNSASTADIGRPVIVTSSPVHKTNGNGAGIIGEGSRSPSLGSDVDKVVFSTDVGPDTAFVGSHYIVITEIELSEYETAMNYLDARYLWNEKLRGKKAIPVGNGSKMMTMYFCVDDLRASAEILQNIRIEAVANWIPRYVHQAEYAAANAQDSSGVQVGMSFYDGQILLIAKYQGSLADITTEGVANNVYAVAESYGEVLAFHEKRQPGTPDRQFRLEYFKMSDAAEALRCLTEMTPYLFGDWSVTATDIPDQAKVQRSTALVPYQSNPDVHMTPTKTVTPDGDIYCSPTGRTAWKIDAQGNKIMCPPPTQIAKMLPNPHMIESGGSTSHRMRFSSEQMPQMHMPQSDPRAHSWPGPNAQRMSQISFPEHGEQPKVIQQDAEPQTVAVGRIASGQDVRTTIMLRNLPNNWTAADLKKCLDKTSFGTYDFSYVRIDFTNSTNVGYAFVNFTDAMHIVAFVEENVGRDWIRGHWPPRKCAVSYATVQGYDCLIEKFRNSAVMLEVEEYRPKLFWTKDTALRPGMVGTERPFPDSNNLSKKQRSLDNAGQVGLYAPRTGYRGADRARRSQYDRGTTSQIQEDALFAQPGNYTTHPGRYTIAPLQPHTFPAHVQGNPYGFNVANQFPAMHMNPAGYPMNQYQAPFFAAPVYNGNAPNGGSYNHMSMGQHAPGSEFSSRGQFGGYPHYAHNAPLNFGGPVMSPAGTGFYDHYASQYSRTPRVIYEETEAEVAPDAQPAYVAHGRSTQHLNGNGHSIQHLNGNGMAYGHQH